MEKNVQIKIELSEEQLRDITGGCQQCIADLNQVTHHITIAKAYTNISDNANALGKDTTLYDNLRDGHADAAKNLMDGVLARGHINPLRTPPLR